MNINQIYEAIGSAKKSGQFQANVMINSFDRNRIVQSLSKDNFLIIEVNPANLIITWIGSKQWYEQSGIRLPYSADMISKEVLPKLIELVNNKNIESIKFLNPLITAKITSKYDKITGDVLKTFDRANTISSAIYKVISKF